MASARRRRPSASPPRSRSRVTARSCVDLDPQGSAGRSLAIDVEDGRGSSALFATKGKVAVSYPAHPALFRLGVIAADPALGDVEAELLADGRRRARLGDGLHGSASTGP